MDNNLNQILNKGEKIIWSGKPVFLVYFFSKISGALVKFITLNVFLVSAILFLARACLYDTNCEPSSHPLILALLYCLAVFYLFYLIFFIIKYFVYTKQYRFREYVLTNKRVIIGRGAVGQDFNSIDYNKIIEVGLDTDPLHFGTDTVRITTVNSVFSFAYITDGVNAFKILEKRKDDDEF